jgi:hypothetical protein
MIGCFGTDQGSVLVLICTLAPLQKTHVVTKYCLKHSLVDKINVNQYT